MGILQMNLAAAVAGVGYLVHAGKFPLASYTELLKEPLGVRVAACTAGACSLVLGLRSLEHMAYSGEQTSGTGPLTRTIAMLENLMGQEKNRNIVVKDWINEYNELHKSNDPAQRNSAYAKMVNAYYELATSFYEWGWGSSFHFSYRMRGESFSEATRRHEYALAAHLGLKPGAKVIDVGCGIGGPMRNIARFTGWDITGVTVNEYQVRHQRCNPQLHASQTRFAVTVHQNALIATLLPGTDRPNTQSAALNRGRCGAGTTWRGKRAS
jgi:hypothetical protein